MSIGVIVLTAIFSAAGFAQTITDFSPASISAGTGKVLTINGTGFGSTGPDATSYVEFKSADDGGTTYIKPAVSEYVSWTSTKIMVKVPTRSGTGIIRVTSTLGSVSSVSTLTVSYNVSNSLTSPIKLANTNTTGGYTFRLETSFNANSGAKDAFQRALETWKCATKVNWTIGPVTTVDETNNSDGVNVIKFDSDSQLDAGTLGVAYSSFRSCGNGWELTSVDLVFDKIADRNWYFGTDVPAAGQIDFQTVALHELGHAHTLGHVNDINDVMNYQSYSGTARQRVLNASNLEAANYAVGISTVTGSGTSCFPPMIALPDGCVPPPAIASFTPASAGSGATVTITGTNFTGITQVSFGNIPAASFTVNSPTSITAVVGAGASGSVTVNASGGIAARTGFTFIQTPQTIIFTAPPPKSFGDPDFDPGATASSGLPVTYTVAPVTVATVVNGKIHIVGGGTATITALQAGNATFAAAPTVSRTLTVNKINQLLVFPDIPPKTFTDAAFDPGASSNSGLPITYTSDKPAVAVISNGMIRITGVGSATIMASQPGNNSYNAAANFSKTLVVSKGSQTITFPLFTAKGKSDPDFDPGATASSGLTVTYTSNNPAVATIVNNKIHPVAEGTVVITAAQSGDGNYAAAVNVTRTLTLITSQTITFPSLPARTFGGADIIPAATASSFLPVTYTSSNTAVATIVDGKIRIIGVGSASITASQSGNATFAPAPEVVRPLSVSKAGQTITFPVLSAHVYGEPDFDPGATVTSGLPISYSSSNVNIATIVNGKIHIVGTGALTITASQDGNANYLPAASLTLNLVIDKAAQTITFLALPSKGESDADFDPAATASSGLAVTYSSSNTTVATIVNGKIHIVGSGTATITASQSGNTNYNPAAPVIQALTVKTTQTITFNPLIAKVFGDDDFDLVATASSGLPVTYTSSNTAVATIVNNKVHIVGAGSATFTAAQPGNATYTAAPNASQVLLVNKASQTIAFAPLPLKNYTDADFDPAATASSGLPVSYASSNTAVASIVNGKVHAVAEGTATITASQAGNANFNAAADVSQDLRVIFTLPVTNFKLSVTGETCKASNNGVLNIAAVKSSNYTAVITGANLNTTLKFTTALEVKDLPSGKYTVCITVDGQSIYKQCYDFIVTAPKDLAVYSTINTINRTLALSLEGGSQYRVELNGIAYITTQNQIELPLFEGNNSLKVSTDKECQGVINRRITLSDAIKIYPNPFEGTLNIDLGNEPSGTVSVELRSIVGKLVSSRRHSQEYGKLALDLPDLEPGVYLLKLSLNNLEMIYKVIKK